MMEAPHWMVGDEKQFLRYMQSAAQARRIALVSHTDHDGVAAAKVTQEVLGAQELFFIEYKDMADGLNQGFLQQLRGRGVSHIVMLDLMVKDAKILQQLEEFAEVLLIDHHAPEVDFNSEHVVYLNAQGMCTTYLAYYLFSKLKNLDAWDWLVACACIADWCYFKNQQWMALTMRKYGEHFIPDSEGIKKSGKFLETQAIISLALVYFSGDIRRVYDNIGKIPWDIGDSKQYASEVQRDVDACIACFHREKQAIRGGYFWEFTSQFRVKSLVINALSAQMPDKTIILARQEGEWYYLSGRRQDAKLSMNELLKQLTAGFEQSNAGGHAAAAGGHLLVKDAPEFKKRLNML